MRLQALEQRATYNSQRNEQNSVWQGKIDIHPTQDITLEVFFLQTLERLQMIRCTSVKSLSGNTCSLALIVGMGMNFHRQLILNKTHFELFFDFPLIECLVNLPQNFANRISLNSPPNLQHDPSITLHKVLSGPAFITLKDLLISDIPMLSEIPDNISLLSSLETLELIDIGITSLPETIKYLPRLFRLHVYFCEMLQSIPTLPLNLVNFTVLDCESLETVLSSKDETKPNPCTVILLNCKKLDPRTVLNNAIAGIGLGATGEDNSIQYLLPDIPEPDREYWFNYRSPQVSFTVELPPNLLGFAYYLVHSGGLVGESARFGCECYLDSSSGERICITRFRRANIFQYGRCCCNETIIPMKSDHVLLWYDPVSCKQIMEAVEKIKSINDMNSTSYNPKLTFKFFIDEHVCHHVVIKECGFRWIYKEETVSSTIFESHDEDEETVSSTIFESHDEEETVPPTKKLMPRVNGRTPMSSLGSDETKGLRYLLEGHSHTGFGGDHMNTLGLHLVVERVYKELQVQGKVRTSAAATLKTQDN
ncbi:putative disease resistance protein (TIR-NBS-LRR class) [Trifolium medium]|uniref:Putative disease resistance protein (TIR-NBS-LRR class) n=1 Tax=Trifolium medium TaxID=97028 RepID=A0A392LY82_9FABA|nr:putative disease resistance protein (TIR-NBS-LRR class) [Trifolium medium]